jgi:hypothetical protein
MLFVGCIFGLNYYKSILFFFESPWGVTPPCLLNFDFGKDVENAPSLFVIAQDPTRCEIMATDR